MLEADVDAAVQEAMEEGRVETVDEEDGSCTKSLKDTRDVGRKEFEKKSFAALPPETQDILNKHDARKAEEKRVKEQAQQAEHERLLSMSIGTIPVPAIDPMIAAQRQAAARAAAGLPPLPEDGCIAPPVGTFIDELSKILQDKANNGIIEWIDGSLKIHSPQRLEEELLSKLSMTKFQSFTAALVKKYRFRKFGMTSKMAPCEYTSDSCSPDVISILSSGAGS